MPRVSCALRVIFALVSWSGLLAVTSGCTHLVESRVVAAFATALEQNDVAGLKQATTDEFENKALRDEQALASLKDNLDIPTNDLKVVKVIDEGDTAKRVTVDIGETGQQVFYRLKQEKSGQWVVDDVYLEKRELSNGYSVSARLDLILSLQAFLDAWSAAEEPGLRTHATQEFCDLLFQLPESERQRMMARLTGDAATQSHQRPEVILREETAECRIARTGADVTVKFKKVDGHWRADDLALDSRRPGEDIASVQNMALATLSAIEFQKAYAAGDKPALQKIVTRRFFTGSLMAADLALVPLPSMDQDKDGPDVTVDGKSASFLLQSPSEVVRIGLVQDPAVKDSIVYRVDEVTLYELNGLQNKRLSSLFTAHAVMTLFHDALGRRSLKELQLNASHDFNTRVWNRIPENMLDRLPLDSAPQGPTRVMNTVFQGPVTTVTVMAGEQPLTYVLRDEQGKVLVDDVQIPSADRPESLKTTCDVLIPAILMTDALLGSEVEPDPRATTRDDPLRQAVEKIRGHSTRDFNRVVWNQLASVPDIPDAAAHFAPGLGRIVAKPDQAEIWFGDVDFGARLMLVKETDAFRIDDVFFVTGREASQQTSLKRSLRARIQSGELAPAQRTALAPEP